MDYRVRINIVQLVQDFNIPLAESPDSLFVEGVKGDYLVIVGGEVYAKFPLGKEWDDMKSISGGDEWVKTLLSLEFVKKNLAIFSQVA